MWNGNVGLSAVLDTSSSKDEKPPSAVSSIASQFNAAASKHDSIDESKKVSDKVSDIATKFGKTVDETPPPKQYKSAAYVHKAHKATASKSLDANVISQSGGKVGDVMKRFANSEAPAGESAKPSDFANAHSLFRRAEEAESRPSETRVSSFAKRIEVGATASFDSESSDRHVAGVTRAFESKGATSLRTHGVPPPNRPSGAPVSKPASGAREEEPVVDGLGKRFENAAKLFENGAANDHQVGLGPKGSAGESEDDASAQSRFADAAKVFGG